MGGRQSDKTEKLSEKLSNDEAHGIESSGTVREQTKEKSFPKRQMRVQFDLEYLEIIMFPRV